MIPEEFGAFEEIPGGKGIEVGQGEEVRIGDVLDFYYTISGWYTKGKIESLVHQLDQDPRWEVKSFAYDEDKGKVKIRVEVLQNPFPAIIIVAAIGAIGAGLFAWLSLDKIEKIIVSPVGAAIGLGTIAAVLLALWGFTKK